MLRNSSYAGYENSVLSFRIDADTICFPHWHFPQKQWQTMNIQQSHQEDRDDGLRNGYGCSAPQRFHALNRGRLSQPGLPL
jgi:hypothetical protein